MTTQTITSQRSDTGIKTGIMPAIMALVLGLGLIMITGVLQSSVLHAAAHDVRHATGFPCH